MDRFRVGVIPAWNATAASAMVEVRYRYRLRVSDSHAVLLQAVFDTCRFVWNQTLGRWEDLWRQEKIALRYGAADKELTDWRSRFEWLAQQPSVPQQQVLRDLYQAIAAFFDKNSPSGRPRFKRKGTQATARWTRRGFTVSGSGLGLAGDRLEVATGAGRIRLRVVWSRPLPSAPTSVTIYRDPAGRWWASFVVRMQTPTGPVHWTGRATGLDLGLDTFATVEDPAHDIPNPRLARARATSLARAQRSLARKRQGSANRAKARRRRARIEAKTAAQRADFHHKAARGLVGAYDRIGVEDLAVKNLTAHGRRRCQHCGLVLERDRNAARNLHPDHPRNHRPGCTGAGSDGGKTMVPAGTPAA